MKLKQHISFDGKVFHGGIDLGAGPSEYDDNPATDAYVMMMTALNGSWKIPIGYFFINSLSAIGTLSNHIHKGCPTFLARSKHISLKNGHLYNLLLPSLPPFHISTLNFASTSTINTIIFFQKEQIWSELLFRKSMRQW